MHTRALMAAAVIGVPAVVIGQVVDTEFDWAPPAAPAPPALPATVGAAAGAAAAAGVIGPDVITASVPTFTFWATDETETSYSFATTACSVGDEHVEWFPVPSDRHPVIGQNMYRLSADGRFEQIGQSWVKHAICALQIPIFGCGDCETDFTCQNRLNVGCGDPYTSVRNGTQSGLGPKWQVNAHSGDLMLNASPPYWNPGEGTEGSMRRRVRVLNSDVDPALNAGAIYVIEGQYVAKDDSAAGNQNNNVSYRPVSVDENFQIHFLGATQREQPGIQAWQDFGENVTLEHVQVPGEGLFIVGYSVTPDGPSWRYEYAVYNMNSDRSAGAFTVPLGRGVDLSDVGFHDVDYHSGDGIGGVNFDGTDWVSLEWPGVIMWATEPHAINASANALRWGTLYNFRFTADAPPTPVVATLGLFKPGTPESVSMSVLAPGDAAPCVGDINDNGEVEFQDLLALLFAWGPCTSCPEDLDADGEVDFQDLLLLLFGWGAC